MTENPSISSVPHDPKDNTVVAQKMTFEWDPENQVCSEIPRFKELRCQLNRRQLRFSCFPLDSGGTSDPPETDHWSTTVELPLRKACSMPPILGLMQFLASSITFMVHVTNVRVFLDSRPIGNVEKSSVEPQPVELPKGIKESSNKEVTMDVKVIQHDRKY